MQQISQTLFNLLGAMLATLVLTACNITNNTGSGSAQTNISKSDVSLISNLPTTNSYVYTVDPTYSKVNMYMSSSDGSLIALNPASVSTGSDYPQFITIAPNVQSAYVLSQQSILSYSINQTNGLLIQIGKVSLSNISASNQLVITPDGLHAYLNNNRNSIIKFDIASSGELQNQVEIPVTQIPLILAIESGILYSATNNNGVCNTSAFSISTNGSLIPLDNKMINAECVSLAAFGTTNLYSSTYASSIEQTQSSIVSYTLDQQPQPIQQDSNSSVITGSNVVYGTIVSPDSKLLYTYGEQYILGYILDPSSGQAISSANKTTISSSLDARSAEPGGNGKFLYVLETGTKYNSPDFMRYRIHTYQTKSDGSLISVDDNLVLPGWAYMMSNIDLQNNASYMYIGQIMIGSSAGPDRVYTYKEDPTNGMLTLAYESESTRAYGIIGTILSPDNNYLYTLNMFGAYDIATDSFNESSASISCMKIDSLNGRLKFVNLTNIPAVNPTQLVITTDNLHAYVNSFNDKNLTSSIIIFNITESGQLLYESTVELPQSSIFGAHLATSGNMLYVTNSENTVLEYVIATDGGINQIGEFNTKSRIWGLDVSPNESFLYINGDNFPDTPRYFSVSSYQINRPSISNTEPMVLSSGNDVAYTTLQAPTWNGFLYSITNVGSIALYSIAQESGLLNPINIIAESNTYTLPYSASVLTTALNNTYNALYAVTAVKNSNSRSFTNSSSISVMNVLNLDSTTGMITSTTSTALDDNPTSVAAINLNTINIGSLPLAMHLGSEWSDTFMETPVDSFGLKGYLVINMGNLPLNSILLININPADNFDSMILPTGSISVTDEFWIDGGRSSCYQQSNDGIFTSIALNPQESCSVVLHYQPNTKGENGTLDFTVAGDDIFGNQQTSLSINTPYSSRN